MQPTTLPTPAETAAATMAGAAAVAPLAIPATAAALEVAGAATGVPAVSTAAAATDLAAALQPALGPAAQAAAYHATATPPGLIHVPGSQSITLFPPPAPAPQPLAPRPSKLAALSSSPPRPAPGILLLPSQESQVYHPADGQVTENYIPFRYPDLRDQLIDDFPKIFSQQETINKFNRFCRWLSARNSIRLTLIFGDVKDKYAYVDPDNDAMDPGAGLIDPSERKTLQLDFEREFLNVLDKGEFDGIPEDALEQSAKVQGVRGLDVDPVDPNIIHYKFWYRGQRKKTIHYSSWKTLWFTKTVETTVYQRCCLQYSMHNPDHVEAYMEHKYLQKWGKCLWGCLKTCCRACFRTKPVEVFKEVNVEPGYVYLKLFKDVELADLDMLLPGAKARFTWFDMLMIWGPIVVGVAMAIWKAASGTLIFKTLMDILLSLVLIVMPLTWGVKAYLAVKDKMAQYQAYLNNLCLTHNLDNNAGVVSGVLDEAQEQEDNEAMLAWFFCWRGLKESTPLRKLDLDAAVEDYLGTLIKKQNLDIRLDFEVCDSIGKLEAMGLLTSFRDPVTGHTMLQVLPLDQAVEQVHIRNFDEKREVLAMHRGKLASAAWAASGLPPWRECESVYPCTGQRFRYFYNVDTGESTYTQPSEFMPFGSCVMNHLAGSMVEQAGTPAVPTTGMQGAPVSSQGPALSWAAGVPLATPQLSLPPVPGASPKAAGYAAGAGAQTGMLSVAGAGGIRPPPVQQTMR